MAKQVKVKAQTEVEIVKKFLAKATSSKDRGIEFSIPFAEFTELSRTPKCYFTGVPLNTISGDANQHTYDRIDNDKGYVSGNVVACSLVFNQIKGNLTVLQINQLYKGIKKAGLI
tara:strand:+ start:255 stop:599 length:345 start_codon:yes stop_codon:yes gene_type:complete